MPSAPIRVHGKIAALTLSLCATPYLGLRLYLALGMHEASVEAALPAPWVLGGLFVLGVLVPMGGVILILRRVLKDRLQFQLAGLLETYVALILVFASSYAIVQSSSLDSSFSGMPIIWSAGDSVVLGVHVSRLHDLFFEALYLSVITITTVGYGDLVPLSRLAKTLTATEGLVGISFVGVALGHYFSICLRSRRAE